MHNPDERVEQASREMERVLATWPDMAWELAQEVNHIRGWTYKNEAAPEKLSEADLRSAWDLAHTP